MLSEDRLILITQNPGNYDVETVAMALEILQLRRTLGTPWAIVQPLGELYVEDGNAAMIWPASLAEHDDICLYRLEKSDVVGKAVTKDSGQRGSRKKIYDQL
ncbi:hypothetical protein QU24_02355 [Pantoea rodasii]|uniref:Uncharacterized protein n=1 Tax=Pantoea rodasii TaxID=1076549 RepID=A0A0B1RF51_9GAMM|nr:hypothetical protein [Pantoea rodasii]KHJ69715.1 hypothetical protein QU24_02355 [Pantoea rodasii]